MDLHNLLRMPLCEKTRIPIKTLVEQIGGETKNKKLIEKHIASVNLVSLLNEQTVRIRAYKDADYSFQTIYILEITLKAIDQMTDFTELVHSAFPESTLLILSYKDKTYISGAYKRINKNDKSRTVIEDCIWAEAFEGLTFDPPSVKDLKDYYEFLMRWLYRIKTQNVTGVFPAIDAEYKQQIKQYEEISSSIKKLSVAYASASMLNEKMRIDEQLYSKENELKKLIESIAGGIN